MLGYMNSQALDQTLVTNSVTFYSRSRACLWVKGETSGNVLTLVDITADCDNDCLLIRAKPSGPTCHLGAVSCFASLPEYRCQLIPKLEAVIQARIKEAPEGSYTARLLKEGIHCVAQKVGEEAVETVIASLVQDDQQLCNEAADLFYHLLVLLLARGLSFNEVLSVLQLRFESSTLKTNCNC